MKKILTHFLFVVATVTVNAQVPPEAFNYSAVARGPQGQPIASQNISIRFSILRTSVNGSIQYVERHQTTTDPFGLFNLRIGEGIVESGNFSSIDWGADDYFLNVELDAQGNINFFNMGTTQFVSVPYALYSGNTLYAQNGIDSVSISGDTLYLSNGQTFINSSNFSGDYNDLANQPVTVSSISNDGDTLYLSDGQTFINSSQNGTFTRYIGEEFEGGVIFHLWFDANGVERGLIVDKTDLSTAQVWSNVDQTEIGPSAKSSWDGVGNSNAIVGQAGHTSSAAALCLNSTNGGYTDWYLPSIQELSMLWNNYYTVARSLSQIAGATELQLAAYWSSTEGLNAYNAWEFSFYGGGANSDYDKFTTNAVRALRAF